MLDPSQKLRGKRDLGIKHGQIAAVEASIPADYTICEPAMQQGAVPDTISSDIHAVSINTPGYSTLPNVMSKILNLGMPLEDVVAKATVEPARIIGRVPGLGTLRIGAPADVAIFDLVDGPVEFVDTRNNKRNGTKKLVPVLTVKGGRPFGRPPMPIPLHVLTRPKYRKPEGVAGD